MASKFNEGDRVKVKIAGHEPREGVVVSRDVHPVTSDISYIYKIKFSEHVEFYCCAAEMELIGGWAGE